MGRGGGRVSGTTGILFSGFVLLADLISTRRARQRTDAGNVRSADSLKTGSSLTPSRALPVDSESRDRQVRKSHFLASIIVEKCVGCGICSQICPVGAILVDGVASVDAGKCTGCGQCVTECPQDALVLRKV